MNEATKIFLIDTNILVYAYDTTDSRKHKIALQLLEKCWKKEIQYAISAQNLSEFFIIITRKVPHPLPVAEAEIIIQDICAFSGWMVLHYTKHTLQRSIQLHKETGTHFWDALIAATMQEAGIAHIYTENEKDFKLFENITVVNPFKN